MSKKVCVGSPPGFPARFLQGKGGKEAGARGDGVVVERSGIGGGIVGFVLGAGGEIVEAEGPFPGELHDETSVRGGVGLAAGSTWPREEGLGAAHRQQTFSAVRDGADLIVVRAGVEDEARHPEGRSEAGGEGGGAGGVAETAVVDPHLAGDPEGAIDPGHVVNDIEGGAAVVRKRGEEGANADAEGIVGERSHDR